jgi:uncharacterized protein (UPF0212 family)
MTVSKAIQLLESLKRTHGDVDVLMDCPFCGKSTEPTTVVAEPIKVKLTSKEATS